MSRAAWCQVSVTVLVRPGPPVISPRTPVATGRGCITWCRRYAENATQPLLFIFHYHCSEGDTLTLSCSTEGGSPTPDIFWYKYFYDINIFVFRFQKMFAGTRRETATLYTAPSPPRPGPPPATYRLSPERCKWIILYINKIFLFSLKYFYLYRNIFS